MKKRILSLGLALILVILSLPETVAAAGSHPFNDVPSNHWGNTAVQYVYENGLMNGTNATAFQPGGTLTRAMFVTILGRMTAVPESSYAGSRFSDVPAGQWYSSYVVWASEKGIVDGTGNGRFSPNAPVTREQMATIIARYLDAESLVLPSSGQTVAGFSDSSSVSSWAKAGLELMRKTGIITGYSDGRFAPKESATRIQAAMVFMRLAEALDTATPAPDNTPAALTEQDILTLYRNACSFATDWFWIETPIVDWSDTIQVQPTVLGAYGVCVRVNYPGVTTKNDVLNLTKQYYTADIAGTLMAQKQWEERSGKLYVSAHDGLGDWLVERISIEAKRTSSTRYTLTVTETLPPFEDTSSTIHLNYVGGYWVFDSELPYGIDNVPVTVRLVP